MNVAVVVGGGVPNPSTSGGTLTAWTVMTQLLEDEHGVALVWLRDPEQPNPTDAQPPPRSSASGPSAWR